jgi:hypothetical protein
MKVIPSVSIPNPCPANWNAMASHEKGKFCHHCQHVVVDFTNMTDAQIKEYFRCSQKTQTCGRFSEAQLDGEKKPKTQFWSGLRQKIEIRYRPSYFRAFLILCISISAFVSGCKRHVPHKVGKVKQNYFEQNDSIKTN